jgi:quercetin dioxygenase-like cupin family protein
MKDLSDLPTSPAPTLEWLGVSYRTILSTAASGGAMSIVDTFSPAGSGPPRHVHHAEDEAFVVLSGEIELWVAGKTSRLGAGEAALVPRGTEHTFKALADTRKLVILTPGGFEGFFAEMARGAFRIPEDMGLISESAARHHLAFTGPPL